MIEIRITNETLSGALEEMAVVATRISGTPKPAAPVEAPGVPPIAPAPLAAPPQPAPAPAAPVQSPAPAAQIAPSAVPTSPAPQFTLEQVGKAGADMIATNPNTPPQLHGLLQQFGVTSINQLKPEQIGPFATALRGLGAKI